MPRRPLMPKSRLAVLSALVVFTASLLAAAPAASPAKSAPAWPQIHFEKYKLPNGLEVILSEDHRLPLVAVNLWYHVGPMYEKPGRTGFAHLFEPKLCTDSRPSDVKPAGPTSSFSPA